ncbi:hypothetical protein SAMN06295960_0296 [Paenibacillus aquistagni]|uniref:S1 motif domain-containing protein n=1 Tax=Paenibacillus aquistagni TaxID=1852522 RepID=A0A1X7IBQ3_9BACL|nr:hypothetical protein SAMN06295960_0296 [Paenibacillus aquistagni]
MTLTPGLIQRLRIDREVSPYGYFLTDGEQDVLLHYTELTRKVKIGEEIDVFLFFDTEDRLASTMKTPLITLGEVALLEIADIHPRYGCFLEMGIGRQLLLPKSELPEFAELHPMVGERIYVVMAHDKIGRLVAKMALEKDLERYTFHAPSNWLNTWQEAIVYRPLRMGTFMIVEGGVLGFGAIGFVHESERPRLLRLGEKVRVRISHVREDGRVNVTLAEKKEVGMDQDSKMLLSFIKERPNAAMPYSDATDADIIKQRFSISKSAFKRALGRLMKAGLIEQSGDWTKLTALGDELAIDDALSRLETTKASTRKPEKNTLDKPKPSYASRNERPQSQQGRRERSTNTSDAGSSRKPASSRTPRQK